MTTIQHFAWVNPFELSSILPSPLCIRLNQVSVTMPVPVGGGMSGPSTFDKRETSQTESSRKS